MNGAEYAQYQHKYHILLFTCQYLGVAYIIDVMALLTGGEAQCLLSFVLTLAAGYFIINFKYHHKKKKDDGTVKEKQAHMGWFVVGLVLSGYLFLMISIEESAAIGAAGIVVIDTMIAATFAVYYYAEYYHQKYLTMYSNPCVNRETIARFEENTKKRLRRPVTIVAIFFVLTIGMTAIMSSVSWDVPAGQEREESEEEKEEKNRTFQAGNREHKKMPEIKEEDKNPIWRQIAQIITKVLMVLVAALLVAGILLLLFFLFRKIFSVKIPHYESVKKEEEKRRESVEEYTSLQPQVRRGKERFSPDANGQIRRSFYHIVRKQTKDKGVESSMTPREIATAHLTIQQQEIVPLYEKARYSGDMCTESEAQKARRLREET